MAYSILSYIRLSAQELTALSNVIRLSFEAFEIVNYPIYFDAFVTAIIQIINLGSAAVLQAAPKISYSEFSIEVDKLAGFIKEVQLLTFKNN